MPCSGSDRGCRDRVGRARAGRSGRDSDSVVVDGANGR